MRPPLLLTALACALLACARGGTREPPPLPRLTAELAARLLPPRVPAAEREGWSRDVLAALDAHELPPDAPHLCGVFAIIEQESGFQANPVVPELPRIVREGLEAKAKKLGPLGRPALERMLAGKAPGQSLTFAQRLERVRTERDLDLVFRELLEYHRHAHPFTFGAANVLNALFGSQSFEDMNPITTAGSMQVSVRWAQELAEQRHQSTDTVRDELYTRHGGVFYGTARLWGYEAAYAEPLYRFADYNAGPYSSRNAALQAQLNTLLGLQLLEDGDLLAYDVDGRPSREDSRTLLAFVAFARRFAPSTLSEGRVRRDLEREKTRELEETETWRTLKAVYARIQGEPAPYAQLPDVSLKSPKLKQERSTAWFARSVDTRYAACQERYRALGNVHTASR
ncbi:DUF1615 family protein [Aggregicoccus sp. 17bor-14]|uniref:DUF1615 family protein n=1 Tax=Myxococcaceae TaxID=31 RepID=UPI00351A69F5